MILATSHQASGPIEPELLAASFELDHDPAGWGTLCAEAVVRVTEVLTPLGDRWVHDEGDRHGRLWVEHRTERGARWLTRSQSPRGQTLAMTSERSASSG